MMMKYLFPLLLFLLTTCSCSKENVERDPSPVLSGCADNPQLCELNAANNTFGFGVFRRLQQAAPDENIFISPLSIGTALAMTANGAAGTTRDEMRQALQLNGLTPDQVNAAYQTLLRVLPALDPAVQARLANSIWYRQGLPVKSSFLTTSEDYFNSEVSALDFAAPSAVPTINGWVDRETEGLIKGILEEIPEEAVMYLINAIYFKGDWKTPFDPKQTSEAPFYRADGSQTRVQMMNHGYIRLPYLETALFQAVDLDYGDKGAFAMSLLLPKEGHTVSELMGQIEAGAWTDWAKGFASDSIFFAMPRFEMTYEKTLNEVLIALGMQKAFDADAADFSAMVDGPRVFITEVKHKAFISVDEKGTKAAAVTSVGVGVTSVPQIPFVVLNRPFLFVIREKTTDAVLFVGQFMTPPTE